MMDIKEVNIIRKYLNVVYRMERISPEQYEILMTELNEYMNENKQSDNTGEEDKDE